MLRTKYNYVPPEGEINNDRRMVEMAAVRTNQQRVRELLMAGFRLEVSRQQFDSALFEDGVIPENYFDVTRDPNFDMADAFQLVEQIRERLKSPPISKNRPEPKSIPVEQRDINKDGKISHGSLAEEQPPPAE